MLIKESQLSKSNNILHKLNEAVYLTEDEYKLNPLSVPVVVKESGTNMVDYEYLSTIAEERSVTLFEAMNLVRKLPTMKPCTMMLLLKMISSILHL